MGKSYVCKILSNNTIAHNMYLMAIKSRDITNRGKPGQFIHIKIPCNDSLLLRRPISINTVDKEKGIVYIVYQVVGEGTEILSLLEKGDTIDILGPLGNGFSVSENIERIALIGGGCGIAPLRYILDYWNDKSYISFLGCSSKDSTYQIDIFDNASENLYLATDDGSQGKQEFITETFKREIENLQLDMIMACGPKNMLNRVQAIAKEYNIPCQISLEERMGCGIGACMVCSCKVKSNNGFEYKRVCADGPVFWSNEVILDD